MRSKKPKVNIYTDGSYKGSTGQGGYSCLMESSGNKVIIVGNAKDTTINKMELRAIITGLEVLTTPCKVTVVSDSQYAVNSINSWITGWERNNWHTSTGKPVSNVDEMQKLVELKKIHTIKANWVRGHNGHYENTICDEIAQSVADKKI